MKTKIRDINKRNTSEERTQGNDCQSSHVIRPLGSKIHIVTGQYVSKFNLQTPTLKASHFASPHEERKKTEILFARYEAHRTRMAEILRRRLL